MNRTWRTLSCLAALLTVGLVGCYDVEPWKPTLAGIDGDDSSSSTDLIVVFRPQTDYFTPLDLDTCPDPAQSSGGDQAYTLNLRNDLRQTTLTLVRLGANCATTREDTAEPSSIVSFDYAGWDEIYEVRLPDDEIVGRWRVHFDPTRVRASEIVVRSASPDL